MWGRGYIYKFGECDKAMNVGLSLEKIHLRV